MTNRPVSNAESEMINRAIAEDLYEEIFLNSRGGRMDLNTGQILALVEQHVKFGTTCLIMKEYDPHRQEWWEKLIELATEGKNAAEKWSRRP